MYRVWENLLHVTALRMPSPEAVRVKSSGFDVDKELNEFHTFFAQTDTENEQ